MKQSDFEKPPIAEIKETRFEKFGKTRIDN
nr:oligopeptidase, OPase {N-terminal} [Treponema denticola, ATCC 35405, Peptide Partial, 29 aa] [Treponema denticola]